MISGMGKKERNSWITLVIVIVVIFALIIAKYQTTLTLVNERVTYFEGEKTIWMEREADLTSKISDLLAQVEKTTLPTSNPDNTTGLKRQGFNGSVQVIKNDLMKHNELIPYEGVLGGKMGFRSKENIYILSDKWVYAYFDDGHINGYMLLSYSVNNENIAWKVIDSYLFGQ